MRATGSLPLFFILPFAFVQGSACQPERQPEENKHGQKPETSAPSQKDEALPVQEQETPTFQSPHVRRNDFVPAESETYDEKITPQEAPELKTKKENSVARKPLSDLLVHNPACLAEAQKSQTLQYTSSGLSHEERERLFQLQKVSILSNETQLLREPFEAKVAQLGGQVEKWIGESAPSIQGVLVSLPDLFEESQSELILAFWGTHNLRGAFVDGQFATKKAHPGDFNVDLADSPESFWIHNGFYNAYLTVRDEVTLALSKHQRPVHIVGHSLGGALAELIALELAQRERIDSKDRLLSLLTIGKPRVGDTEFSVLSTLALKERRVRITDHHDMIPHIPPTPTASADFARALIKIPLLSWLSRWTFAKTRYLHSGTELELRSGEKLEKSGLSEDESRDVSYWKGVHDEKIHLLSLFESEHAKSHDAFSYLCHLTMTKNQK